ncbi:dTDP-4-dehydrorhamnose reductase [Metabacillus indicus]|uniref:dTDP-4-dehydrorhamnose reductase n=1 Tax=Metabacillus indicus TaxID=246786 RepID=UPI003CF33A62
MNVLITGAGGQLGRELSRQLQQNHKVAALTKSDLDVANKEEVQKVIGQKKPEMIIHAAAFTDVDQCEANRRKAFEVNWRGTAAVARAAEAVQARLIYISTDYVFDGKKKAPYTEADTPFPLSVYGLSKLYGEKCVLDYKRGTVIRTSWLFGHEGKNFLKAILRQINEGNILRVVEDQIGSPTYVKDLAEIILKLDKKTTGIYHVSNTGACSRYEFAKAIVREARLNSGKVFPVSTDLYESIARRPAYSVMAHHALERAGVAPPRPWQEALKDFFIKENSDD